MLVFAGGDVEVAGGDCVKGIGKGEGSRVEDAQEGDIRRRISLVIFA